MHSCIQQIFIKQLLCANHTVRKTELGDWAQEETASLCSGQGGPVRSTETTTDISTGYIYYRESVTQVLED